MDLKSYRKRIASGLVLALAASAVIWALASEKRAVSTAVISTNRATLFPVIINTAGDTPRVATGKTNYHGQAVTVSCSTCHATTTPNHQLREARHLQEFHQGMVFNHGPVTCLSCHNKNDYDSLRLADGASLPFSNVMQLCSQCHGPQARDYRNGSHGGMNGHWDLSRGPRQRNNCVDCHDPHAPQYPTVMPVFPPKPPGKTRLDGGRSGAD